MYQVRIFQNVRISAGEKGALLSHGSPVVRNDADLQLLDAKEVRMSAIHVKGIEIPRKIPEAKATNCGYENLAIAIVATACQDYRVLRRRLRWETAKTERNIIKGRMKEIELFFKSEYGDLLSFGKADFILKMLEAGG